MLFILEINSISKRSNFLIIKKKMHQSPSQALINEFDLKAVINVAYLPTKIRLVAIIIFYLKCFIEFAIKIGSNVYKIFPIYNVHMLYLN